MEVMLLGPLAVEDTKMSNQTSDIAGLQFAIANEEGAAQNAEDNEQLARASKHRAKARELKTQLEELLAKQPKEPKTIRVAGCCRSCREGQYNQGHEGCSSAADRFIAQGWTIVSEEYVDGGWEARLQAPQEKPAT